MIQRARRSECFAIGPSDHGVTARKKEVSEDTENDQLVAFHVHQFFGLLSDERAQAAKCERSERKSLAVEADTYATPRPIRLYLRRHRALRALSGRSAP